MKLGQSAAMFAAGAAWSTVGLRSAGRVLCDGLASNDETVRTIAGILLVRAGARSRQLLSDALAGAAPGDVPMLLRILGELGEAASDPEIERYTHNSDPEIAQAARDALRAAEFARQDRKKKTGT